MKKIYLKPETEVFEVTHEQYLLSGSTEGRSTENLGDLSGNVGGTEDTPDPFGGKGQDGGTTRAPGFFGDFDE